ncbi:MAG: UDP-3-O-acyl-N-acetylglucosamine deacetylase, partial [Isosphaeraceae bacterium]
MSGRGYLSGRQAQLIFQPAPPDSGIVFIRTDLPGQPEIPATIDNLLHSQRRTAIAKGTAAVEMVEHVMAALAGLGIDNCRISIDGPEIPGCDGSSLAFVQALAEAGIEVQPKAAEVFVVSEPATVSFGGMMASIVPSADSLFQITYTLDYPNSPVLGVQIHDFRLTHGSFARELAPARTFVLEEEIRQLHAAGIGRHCTADDLLIFGPDGPTDNGLRFANEPVRHKMLDTLGDLHLLGCRIQGHVVAYRSGHQMNAELAKMLRKT